MGLRNQRQVHRNGIYQYGMLRVIYKFNILGGKNALKDEKKRRRDGWDGEWDGDFGDWGM